MTRINANIPPSKLIDQHLLAEYREITRIPRHMAIYKFDSTRKRTEFTLNTGHVLYFYDKIKFLHKRFNSLKEELTLRGIENNIDDSCFKALENRTDIYNDIEAEKLLEGNKMIIERICDRVYTMKVEPKFRGKQIPRDVYINNLLKYNI